MACRLRRAVPGQVLNLEPSRSEVWKLAGMLQEDEEWADDFVVEPGGVEALSDLLGRLEQKTIKEPEDFEMMRLVLIIHTHAASIICECFARPRTFYRPLSIRVRAVARCCTASGC